MMAGLFAGVTDGIAGFDGALARNGAGAREDRFKQRRLAALERTDQGDGARSGRARAVVTVCRHERSPAREPPPLSAPPRADAIWRHDKVTWFGDLWVLLALSGVSVLIVALLLRRLEPRRRAGQVGQTAPPVVSRPLAGYTR